MINIMCKAVEEYGKKERMEGRLEMLSELIIKFIKKGSSYSEIADDFGISVDEVKKIATSLT